MNQKTRKIIATAFGSGSTHDFHLFKDSRSLISAHICTLADAGYPGIGNLYENSKIPAKKFKLHPLAQEQNTYSHKISSKRIFVEIVIRSLKIFRLLSERYRNRPKRFGLRSNLIAAIYNLELNLIDFCKRSIDQ